MDWTALWVSLRLAAATTAVLWVVGIPLAWWLARTRARLRPFAEAVVALPIVLPPTVAGFYLLMVMRPDGVVGTMVEQTVGGRLPFTFAGILIASVLFNLPFAVRPFQAAFESVDQRLMDASWCLGVSRWGTFVRLAVPLSAPGLVAGSVLTFAHTLGEFGVVLMVGGAVPGVTRTASVAVYDDVQAMDYASAGRTAIVLVMVCLGAMLATTLIGRRGWTTPRAT